MWTGWWWWWGTIKGSFNRRAGGSAGEKQLRQVARELVDTDSQSSVKGSQDAPGHSVIHPFNAYTPLCRKKVIKIKSRTFRNQIASKCPNLGRSHALISSFLMPVGNIVVSAKKSNRNIISTDDCSGHDKYQSLVLCVILKCDECLEYASTIL